MTGRSSPVSELSLPSLPLTRRFSFGVLVALAFVLRFPLRVSLFLPCVSSWLGLPSFLFANVVTHVLHVEVFLFSCQSRSLLGESNSWNMILDLSSSPKDRRNSTRLLGELP